jgi:hypothetical protein
VDTIGMQRGERLQAEGTLGVVVYDELIRLIAGLHEWGDVEHNGDGTHGDITAESVTISGDLSVDGFVGPLDFGDDDYSIVVDGVVIGPETADDYSGFPLGGATADAQTPFFESSRSIVPATDDNRDLGYTGDTDRRWRNGLFSHLVQAAFLHAITGLFERNRGTAVGEWDTVTFAAGNFTGTGAQTWTLTSPDQADFKYTLVGKTMTVKFQLATTSVGGVAATGLQILIPGGFVAASVAYNAAALILDNGVLTPGRLSVAAAGTKILVERSDTAVWTAAANTTYVYGQITIEVQ